MQNHVYYCAAGCKQLKILFFALQILWRVGKTMGASSQMHKGEEQLAELLDASEDAWAPWSACGRVFVLALDSIFLLMQSLGNSSDGSCCHVGELN